MNLKENARFALGATLFSPVLALEDVLRYCGVPVSEHGLTKNDEGKGILQIWEESVPKRIESPKIAVTPTGDIRQRVDEINRSLAAMAEGFR